MLKRVYIFSYANDVCRCHLIVAVLVGLFHNSWATHRSEGWAACAFVWIFAMGTLPQASCRSKRLTLRSVRLQLGTLRVDPRRGDLAAEHPWQGCLHRRFLQLGASHCVHRLIFANGFCR